LGWSVFSWTHAQADRYVIATGRRGGNYYHFGEYISRRYSEAFPASFGIIETEGSTENIELLRRNAVDLALIQRNVLLAGLYNDKKGIKNIEAVYPLFEEKLWIYHHGPDDRPLRDLGKDSIPAVIGFTSPESYSYKTYRTIMRFLNIPRDRLKEVFFNYDTLISRFQRNELDYLVTFSLPLPALDSAGTRVMYLSRGDAEFLRNRLHRVSISSLGEGKYTLGTWSFLTGRKSMLKRLVPSEKLITSLSLPPRTERDTFYARVLSESFEAFRNDPALRSEQLKNLPLHPSLRRALGMPSYPFWPYVLIIATVLLALGWHFYITGKWIPKYHLLFIWNRYKHFQLGFLALLFIYFASIEVLIWSEWRFYENIGIKSQILNMNRRDLHYWLFVTTVTGNSNGIFPLSTLGKIMVSINSLNFWIGTILIGVSEYAVYKMSKKRKQGIMETKFSDHLVVFGWTENTPSFLESVLKEGKAYHQKDIRIVSVVPDAEEIRRKYPVIKELHDNKVIDLIRGDARDPAVLEKAGVNRADTIVLLAEDNTLRADERTLLRALAISRYVNNHPAPKRKPKWWKKWFSSSFARYPVAQLSKGKPIDRIYMIAEINHPSIRENLFEAGVNEVVVAGNYRKAIMKQSIFNHGLSKVFDEILQYNNLNEFYKVDLADPENNHLAGLTFDQLLPLLRKEGILLVGVHIIFHDSEGNIVIDKDEIRRLLNEHEPGITRDVIINPKDPTERNRPVDADDHLIVLAYNIQQLRQGIKRLKKLLKKSS